MTPGDQALPDFIPPMLARRGAPFDSDAHLFEIKWDGTRAQARIPEPGSYTLTNRRRNPLTQRYPEFGILRDTGPGGTVLDGEIVVLKDGRPDFPLLLSREQAQDDRRIHNLSRTLPATFVAFDLLYAEGHSVMGEPLHTRRQLLQQMVEEIDAPQIIVSDGIVGDGQDYFAAAVEQSLEGIMAKRLASPYQPGARSDDWQKIKETHRLLCAILGFVVEDGDLRSLIIAAQLPADEGGPADAPLRCVGRVGSGLSRAMRENLLPRLEAAERTTPWLDNDEVGRWVEPGLYCRVRYLSVTANGNLRGPVFDGCVEA